jgi:ankyrin repeat protein
LWATLEGHRSTIALLIENGADVNARTQNGETVMDFVRRWDDATLMRLVEKKFDVRAREDERLLALKRRENVLRLLEGYKTG